MSVVSQHRAGENVKNPAPQDTQTRSRLLIGDFGPSDSALAASSGWRLRRTVADRHAARCASRDLCSGGAPRRYSPSAVSLRSLSFGHNPMHHTHGPLSVAFHPLGLLCRSRQEITASALVAGRALGPFSCVASAVL